MSFEVYQPEKKGKVVRLRLKDLEHSIILCAVDENGDGISGGNLLQIKKSTGEFFMYPSVKAQFGFELYENGCIVVHY